MSDKRLASNSSTTRPTGAPIALYEDDTLLPPEKPTSGPEIDDLIPETRNEGGTEGVRKTPDLNVYQQKKTLAQGMMDIALLTANANQLRYVLDSGSNHSYYYIDLTFIIFSIALQILVGVLLLWNSRFNINKEHHIVRANKINNFTVVGIFLITILNVLISAFGLSNMPPVMAKQVSDEEVETITNNLDLVTKNT